MAFKMLVRPARTDWLWSPKRRFRFRMRTAAREERPSHETKESHSDRNASRQPSSSELFEAQAIFLVGMALTKTGVTSFTIVTIWNCGQYLVFYRLEAGAFISSAITENSSSAEPIGRKCPAPATPCQTASGIRSATV